MKYENSPSDGFRVATWDSPIPTHPTVPTIDPGLPYHLTVRLESLKLAASLYSDLHRADAGAILDQAKLFERYILGTGVTASQEGPESPPKRRPGRPRKQPLSADTPA